MAEVTMVASEPRKVDALFERDPATVRCPFPAYAELRDEEPVRWVDKLGAWMVTRHADVAAILREPERFSSRLASGPGSVTPLAQQLIDDPSTEPRLRAKAERRIRLSKSAVLLFADPPHHRRQRQLVNKAFTARRVREMEPSVVDIVDDLIDRFVHDGEVELVEQFAIGLPMQVIADVLGVPIERRDDFKRWSDAFVIGTGSMDLTSDEVTDVFAAVDEFYDYFTAQIAARRAEPTDDLLAAIVNARLDGETPLTDDEMLQMLVQFLVAGNETTTNLLASTIFRLVTDEALLRRVLEDLDQVPSLVEEVLRLESPVQGLFRVANEDTELGGVPIAAGDLLFISYAAANRDGDAFDAPDELVTGRKGQGPHLAFGLGEHFCLGAPIARLEAAVGVRRLLERLPDLRLAVPEDQVPYLLSFGLRSITELPLRFTPTTS